MRRDRSPSSAARSDQAIRDGFLTRRVHEDARIPDGLWHRGRRAGHHDRSAGERLDDRQTQALVEGHVRHDARMSVQRLQHVVIDKPEERDPAPTVDGVDRRVDLGGVPSALPDDHELQITHTHLSAPRRPPGSSRGRFFRGCRLPTARTNGARSDKPDRVAMPSRRRTADAIGRRPRMGVTKTRAGCQSVSFDQSIAAEGRESVTTADRRTGARTNIRKRSSVPGRRGHGRPRTRHRGRQSRPAGRRWAARRTGHEGGPPAPAGRRSAAPGGCAETATVTAARAARGSARARPSDALVDEARSVRRHRRSPAHPRGPTTYVSFARLRGDRRRGHPRRPGSTRDVASVSRHSCMERADVDAHRDPRHPRRASQLRRLRDIRRGARQPARRARARGDGLRSGPVRRARDLRPIAGCASSACRRPAPSTSRRSSTACSPPSTRSSAGTTSSTSATRPMSRPRSCSRALGAAGRAQCRRPRVAASEVEPVGTAYYRACAWLAARLPVPSSSRTRG